MKRFIPIILVLALFLSACDSQDPVAPQAAEESETLDLGLSKSSNTADELAAYLDAMNVALAEEGAEYRAAMAEWITGPDAGEAGGTVIAKDIGNKQLSTDFVPFDGRRAWSGPPGTGDDITYAIDTTIDAVPPFGGLSGAQTDAAIVRAHDTWNNVNCSTLPLVRNPDFGIDIGLVAFIFSGGTVGSPFVFADVQHAGWRDLNFGGGILGVAFTFIFVDGSGPTDIDGDGRFDTALREIYYDPSFSWADDGVTNIDVETVAVHEIGHGLSQAHFGTIQIKNDGTLKASPRAVMNALYTSPFRALTGTDNGGHCSNWAQWPNN